MNIKSLKPNFRAKTKQGYYQLKNPKKYKGETNEIIFRSGWEYAVMRHCDLSNDIVEWSSEPIGIKYVSPIDNKVHDYFVDFYICIVTETNEVKRYLAEVKPIKDYKDKPIFEGKQTVKKMESYKQRMKTWLINNAKFKYAKEYAKVLNMEFIILNEDSIFGKAINKK